MTPERANIIIVRPFRLCRWTARHSSNTSCHTAGWRIGGWWLLTTGSAALRGGYVAPSGDEVRGYWFVVCRVERQFQQRQRELEQPGQQELRPCGSFLKMILSDNRHGPRNTEK